MNIVPKFSIASFLGACCLLFMLVPGPARAGERMVWIEVRDAGDLAALERLDVSVEDRLGDWVSAEINDGQIEALQGLGLRVSLSPPPDWEQIERSVAKADQTAYHTYASILKQLRDIEAAHPDIAKVYSLGSTFLGRDIPMIKISDHVDQDENEPEIFFEAAIHGNEWSPMEVAMHLIDVLTSRYGSDPEVTAIVDGREIWVEPLSNPDGFLANTRGNYNAVDLNRDFPYMWDGWGNSPSPLSQPESLAMASFEASRSFTISASLHSGAQYFAYPWSYHASPTPDSALYDAIAAAYCGVTGYDYGEASTGMYFVDGDAKDMSYGALGSIAFTIEVSTQKTPPWSSIPPLTALNEPVLLELLEKAGQGISATVTDSSSGVALPAVIRILPLGWTAYSNPELGDVHRFLLPGTYDIEIWANGYEPVTVEDVDVDGGAAVDLSTTLDVMSDPRVYAYRVLYTRMPNASETPTWTVSVLGPPDGYWLSLGNGGYAVIDMGPGGGVTDVAGDNLTVYEGGSTPEGFELYASNRFTGPWTLVGEGWGTQGFDLTAVGMASARYLKIVDDNVVLPGDTVETQGFDLDAIEAIPATPDADFSADPRSGAAPLGVQFQSLHAGTAFRWLWDFGDGSAGSGESPAHAYSAAGDYTVSLVAIGIRGSDIHVKTAYIHVTEPVADAGPDGASDSGADTDAGADSGADAGPDSGADGDGDSDADTDSDSDADADANADSGTDADVDADTDTDTDSDTDTDADGDADGAWDASDAGDASRDETLRVKNTCGCSVIGRAPSGSTRFVEELFDFFYQAR